MNIRRFALAAAAVLSPIICTASPESAALNACARAFASSLAAAGSAPPAFKVVYGGERNVSSATDFFARTYIFDLHARNQKTGLPIARASCSTDLRGSVISLSSIPLDAVRRDLTAQN
jgi:hypothetical protein